MTKRDVLRVLFMTLWLYSLLGWIYIVINSEVHMYTLGWRLTHFFSWPHEDTFGSVCMAISIPSFFIWQLLRIEPKPKKK